MTVEVKPLAEVTQQAIRVLIQELGPVDTVRFVNQFTVGYGLPGDWPVPAPDTNGDGDPYQ